MLSSERLRMIREDRGVTQKEISLLIKVSSRTWQNYEEGSSRPGMDICEKIVRLGYSANWLLTGEGSMHSDMACDALAAGFFNRDLMVELIGCVERALTELKVELAPEAKAALIVRLYDIYAEEKGAKVDVTEIKRHLKLVV